jgi:hypothetical protein
VRAVAGWVSGRVTKPGVADPRDARVIAAENDELRQEVASLLQTVAELQQRDAVRSLVGTLKEYCTPVSVVGTDAAGREALLVSGSSLSGLKEGQAALYGGSVVGKIDTPPGVAGAQVRLITDPGFRVEAVFARLVTNADGAASLTPLNDIPQALVEGVGKGTMRCATDITMDDVTKSGLQAGDWVILRDKDWHTRLQHRRLGKVISFGERPTAPLYADIRIQPATSLLQLHEVMVVTKLGAE